MTLRVSLAIAQELVRIKDFYLAKKDFKKKGVTPVRRLTAPDLAQSTTAEEMPFQKLKGSLSVCPAVK